MRSFASGPPTPTRRSPSSTSGLRALDEHYDEQLAEGGDGVAATVLGAHHAIARDPALREYLVGAVRSDNRSAAGAIAAAEAHFSAMLAASGSLLLRERGLDIRDVCGELYHAIYGGGGGRSDRTRLTADSVCIADNLTPGEFLSLDRNFLKGLVLAHSASTSHTIVLARSFGIPTLTGVAGLGDPALDGSEVVVDADLGVLVTTASADVRRYYELEDARLAGRRERLKRRAEQAGGDARWDRGRDRRQYRHGGRGGAGVCRGSRRHRFVPHRDAVRAIATIHRAKRSSSRSIARRSPPRRASR